MRNETIAGLVKDLTTQLSAIAVEFGTRADQLASGETLEGKGDALPEVGQLAKRLLTQRVMRFDHFPAELFHEPAWDMLLALFVAHEERRTMNVKNLVASAHAPVTTSQRWIDHLHKLNLIDASSIRSTAAAWRFRSVTPAIPRLPATCGGSVWRKASDWADSPDLVSISSIGRVGQHCSMTAMHGVTAGKTPLLVEATRPRCDHEHNRSEAIPKIDYRS